MPNIKARIKSKHDTEANWALAENFKPYAGEIIVYDVDANHAYPRFKVGDGKTNVNDLPFSTDVLENYITLYTTQTITGAKTFSQQVVIPETPTANTHASSKGYVDTTVTNAVSSTRSQLEKEIGLIENSVTDLSNSMTNVAVQMAGGISLGTVLGPSGQGAITIPTIAGPTGATGADGDNGYTWIPSVASNGMVSWTSTQAGPGSTPASVNIIGPTGVGITGVTFEETGTTTNGDVIPMPTAEDSGKYLSVNSSGDYQLSTIPSNTYTLPVATSTTLGGVKPTTKSSSMTQSVGVDSSGALWTEPSNSSSSSSSLYKHIITMSTGIDSGTSNEQYLVIEFLDSRSSITFSDFINLLLNIGETSKQSYIYSNYDPGVYPIFKDCYILDYTNLSGDGSSYDGITPSTLTVMNADSEDISTMNCILYVKSLDNSTTYEITFNAQKVISILTGTSSPTSLYEDIAILIQ